MNKRLSFSVVWLLLAVGFAFGQDVRYNFDKNTDFSKLKTYKWVTLKEAAKVNDLVDKQIMDAVDTELATKGLTKVGDDGANLYIGYQAAIGQEKQFTSYSSDWDMAEDVPRRLVWWRRWNEHDQRANLDDLRGPVGGRYV